MKKIIHRKALLINFWPILFLLTLFFIYGWPYFFQNKIPFPSAYLVEAVAPWKNYLPHGPFKNGIPDVPGQLYPWKYFTIQALKSGQIPLWNPYIFSGTPHLANFQTAVFSPFNILFFLLPFVDAWSLLILLQYLLAGLLAYVLSRELGLSKEGSLLSAVAFSFSGFLVSWGAYGTLGYAISFLPLALLAIEKIFAKEFKFIPLLVMALVFSFFSGHIQTSLYLVLAILTYLLVKLLILKPDRKTLLAFVLGFVLSFILILPQFWPTLKFYQNSGRVLVNWSVESWQNLTFQWPKLITFLAPDFFGNPVTRNDWFSGYAEWMGFFGTIPCVLAILAVLEIKKQRKLWPLVAIGILGFILATNNPISLALSRFNLPIFSNSTPSRAMVLVSFAGSLLAGFGLDYLTKRRLTEKKHQYLIFAFALIFALLWFLTLILPIPELKTVSRRNLFLPTVLFLCFSGVILLYQRVSSRVRWLLILSILFLATFDLLRFAKKWQPFEPREWAYPQVAVLDFLQKQPGHYRFFGQMGMAAATISDLPTIDGYDPLNLARYGEFIDSTKDGRAYQTYRIAVVFQTQEKYTKKILDLLGVKYLIYDAGNPQNEFVFPVWEYKNYPKIFDDGKYLIFENKDALPRVKLFYDYVIKREKQEILDEMYNQNFDLAKTLVLEKELSESIGSGLGNAEIVSLTANTVEIKVKTSSPAILFFSDNYYPSWAVEVNGKEIEILRADYNFKAVPVPSGESIVKFFMRWI